MKSVVCDVSRRVWLNWLWQFLSSAFGPVLSSSPSICAGISMKTTSRYLIHSLVPLAPGLTTVWHPRPSLCLSNPPPTPASKWFHFFSPEVDCRRAVDPVPSSSAKPDCSPQIWCECGHTGWFTGCRWPQDTCVFGRTQVPPMLSFVFCCRPLIYAPRLWWTFRFHGWMIGRSRAKTLISEKPNSWWDTKKVLLNKEEEKVSC